MIDRILVTGGAGFVGSHLGERLVSKGHHVVCLDNFDSYYSAQIKKRNIAELIASGQAELIEADIRRIGLLREVVSSIRPTAIVHLAARPGVRQSLTNPRVYFDNNLNGTLNVLLAARQANVPRVILASTSSVYGTVEGPANEDGTPCRPLSPYGASKVGAEALCSSFAQSGDMSVIALRFFTVVGPRQRPDMAIPQFTLRILDGAPIRVFGDGSSMRDYTYVSDIVSAVETAISVEHVGYAAINIGGGNPIALSRVIGLIEENLGKKATMRFEPPHPVDPNLTFADIQKARQMLGYEPQVTIEEAISRYIQWFKKQPATSAGSR